MAATVNPDTGQVCLLQQVAVSDRVYADVCQALIDGHAVVLDDADILDGTEADVEGQTSLKDGETDKEGDVH